MPNADGHGQFSGLDYQHGPLSTEVALPQGDNDRVFDTEWDDSMGTVETKRLGAYISLPNIVYESNTGVYVCSMSK